MQIISFEELRNVELYVSIFTVGSVFGYIAETLWCLLTNHVIESRRGMIFGPFSQVYGLGAVLLTILIGKKAPKKKIFFQSAVIGGVYEYACSYVQEKLFGTVSWDYGNAFFSIGGRTSAAYCVFWGIMGVLLIKGINPHLEKLLEKIRGNAATVAAAAVSVFFILNLRLSFMAVKRQSDRRQNIPAQTPAQMWLDENYDDKTLKKIYPNMVVVDGKD